MWLWGLHKCESSYIQQCSENTDMLVFSFYPPVGLSDSADCRCAFPSLIFKNIISSTDNGKSTDSDMYTASSLYRFDLIFYLRAALSPLVHVRRRTLASAFLHIYLYWDLKSSEFLYVPLLRLRKPEKLWLWSNTVMGLTIWFLILQNNPLSIEEDQALIKQRKFLQRKVETSVAQIDHGPIKKVSTIPGFLFAIKRFHVFHPLGSVQIL